jgi:superoxide dismutase, Fe-Mn family
MDARLQNLPFDPAKLSGLSPGLIASHHQNNYGGAVKRLNAIRAQLATTAFSTTPGLQLNGLKREEFIAMGKALGGGPGWVLWCTSRARAH